MGNLFFRNSLTANIAYLSQITDSLELLYRLFVIPYHILSFLLHLFIHLVCVFMCVCAVVRGQLFRVRCSRPPTWFQGSNSGHLAWLQVSEPPGSFHCWLPEVLQNVFVFYLLPWRMQRCLLCPFPCWEWLFKVLSFHLDVFFKHTGNMIFSAIKSDSTKIPTACLLAACSIFLCCLSIC